MSSTTRGVNVKLNLYTSMDDDELIVHLMDRLHISAGEITILKEDDFSGTIDGILDDGYVLKEGVTREDVIAFLIDAHRDQKAHDIEAAAERRKWLGDWPIYENAKSEFFTEDEGE